MEALWNQMNLQKPPYRSWEVSTNNFDLKKFATVVKKITDDFCIFDSLDSEAALLSRLIYRMKSKFRTDKGLKEMEKLNRALLNYLNMNMQKDFELLRECVETSYEKISLPSRQSLEYVLVRIQGFSKLMSRIEETAKAAGNYLKSRISIGQSWSVAVIAYSVVSRIWTLARYILKKSCSWYGEISKQVKIFKMVGPAWLPEDYTLPDDLEEWLALDWMNEEIDESMFKKSWTQSIFDLMETNEENVDENSISDDLKKIENMLPEHRIIETEIDLGEPVSRELFEKSQLNLEKSNKKKSPKKKSGINLSKTIKNEKDLVKFLQADGCPGLSKSQWSDLKKSIKKLAVKSMKKHKGEKALPDDLFTAVNETINNWKNTNLHR